MAMKRAKKVEKKEVEIPYQLKAYHRKVIAGTGVRHHGDCHIFLTKICTCGLIHALMPLDNAEKYFPKFHAQMVEHERIICQIRDGRRKEKADGKLP